MTKKPEAVETVAAHLAGVGIAALPDRITERIGDCILDTIAAAAAGVAAESSRAVISVSRAAFPGGPSTVWFSADRRIPSAAAFSNGMAATALDIDDGHRRCAGHPGAAVVTAALATAEQVGATFGDLVIAVYCGYEAAVRAALSRNPAHNTSTASGRWSGIGAAAARAKLLGLDAPHFAQAILIAENHGPRVAPAMLQGFSGAHVKEGIAWSVFTGMMAVDLAVEGFTGYPDTFDQDTLYNPLTLMANLGRGYAVDGLFFKPYACCRWIHAAIDALVQITEDAECAWQDIDEIRVHTFERGVGLGNSPRPITLEDAQFSVPFCLAVTAVRGTGDLKPMATSVLQDDDILSFAKKVTVHFDDGINSRFPEFAGARVAVQTGTDVIERQVDAPFGDPTNPMDRSALQDKFRQLAPMALSEDAAETIIAQCAMPVKTRTVPVSQLTAHLYYNSSTATKT